MKFKFFYFNIFLFAIFQEICSRVNYNNKVNIFFLNENYIFHEADFKIEVENTNSSLVQIDSLPTDLINQLKLNKLEEGLEITLNQGTLDLFHKKSFSEYKSIDKKVKRNNNFRLPQLNNLNFDYFFDNIGTNLLFSSAQVSTNEKKMNFKRLLDNFAENLKIPKFYLTDFTNAIKFSSNKQDLLYANDVVEKPCIDNLDGIKRLLPIHQWTLFKDMVNYQSFVNSEFKTIKYYFKQERNKLILNFKIAHYMEINSFLQYYDNNRDRLTSVKYITYNLSKSSLEMSLSLNDSTNEKQNILVQNFHENYGISSQRRLQGSVFGFENFELIHDIFVKQTTENKNQKLEIKLVDMIPEQFDIMFSSLKIFYEIYTDKGEVKTQYFFDYKNYKHFLKLSFNITEMQHPVLWSYEQKRKINVYLEGIKLLPNSKLRISYELRKRLLNFESFENEFEFGYKVPAGALLFSYEGDNSTTLYVTDQMYFNVPTIDNTMPFNVIALTWVVIGVFLIQTLNLFIGDKSKSFISKIKDKVLNFFTKNNQDDLKFKQD